jgi:hypothetical protein
MSLQLKRMGIVLVFAVFILACNIYAGSAPIVSTATNQPAFDPTKAALEFQATMMSQQLTQSAANLQPQPTQQQPALPTSPPATVAAPEQPTQIPPTPTEDIEAKIKSANVLVYENTDDLGIGMWIQDALDGLNIKYTQTGSYSGRFMEHLNSGKKYDLIIVGAESKKVISGEFWDVINTRLARDKTALIMEVWYLDSESNGPINKILGKCGVRYQKDYSLADSIYWWDSTHPIFTEPNTVLPLLHYNRYWANQTGDRIRLSGSGDATLLAGLAAQKASDGAVLATCYDGRVIVQTFSDHDYSAEDIIPLWENYIHYTLKNHFLAEP